LLAVEGDFSVDLSALFDRGLHQIAERGVEDISLENDGRVVRSALLLCADWSPRAP
jgi:hypothetical protein